MERLLETDTIDQLASKIFNHFDVGQSCNIKGLFVHGDILTPRGKSVIERLSDLDKKQNYGKTGRKRKAAPGNFIGGKYLSEKIFRWEERTINGMPAYTIWRMQ